MACMNKLQQLAWTLDLTRDLLLVINGNGLSLQPVASSTIECSTTAYWDSSIVE